MVFAAAFIVGGILCMIGQLLLDLTNYRITPAHLLAGYISAGAILSAIGIYGPLVDWAGAGALIPISGLGHLMTESTFRAVDQDGFLGTFTGPFEAPAAALTAALVFTYFAAFSFKPRI